MKREFLENFKIGDQGLSKEVIDAIMEENGRDIEAAKKPFADYDHLKEQLKTAQDGLKAFEGVDVQQLQGEISRLQGDLSAKDAEWQKKMDGVTFESKVKDAITTAKGKNAKAIAALLDMDTLRGSKNQDADLKAALEAVKQENGYLFKEATTPPPYASGTGTSPVGGTSAPATLAGALKERYAKG